jgi:hypothetical protein
MPFDPEPLFTLCYRADAACKESRELMQISARIIAETRALREKRQRLVLDRQSVAAERIDRSIALIARGCEIKITAPADVLSMPQRAPSRGGALLLHSPSPTIGARYMPIFAVSRIGDDTPLLVLSAENAIEAVADANKEEETGAFGERGYLPSKAGYTAAPATSDQIATWMKAVATAIEEGVINPHTDDPEFVAFMRPPEFNPAEDDSGTA